MKLENISFDKVQCQKELDELKDLFKIDPTTGKRPNIAETRGAGNYKGGLQGIFNVRKNVFALMGRLFFGQIATKWTKEAPFGKFRADYVLANKTGKKVCMIEFEGAMENSIFSLKNSKKGYEWSRTFDHGYSQILDWKYYSIEENSSMTGDFQTSPQEISFALIVGWDSYLNQYNFRKRFDFRKEHVVIASRPFYCYCFDTLVEELQEQLDLINQGV